MTPQQEAFEVFYRQHVDRVMAYCLRHAEADAADDAVSETFLTAWRRRAEVDQLDLPWLLVTARNHLRNARRSQARSLALADRVRRYDMIAGLDPGLTAEHRQRLLSALAALGDDDREAVLLTSWDGLTSAEAAAVLGVSPGALRVRIHRARARMSEALTREENHAC